MCCQHGDKRLERQKPEGLCAVGETTGRWNLTLMRGSGWDRGKERGVPSSSKGMGKPVDTGVSRSEAFCWSSQCGWLLVSRQGPTVYQKGLVQVPSWGDGGCCGF